MERIVPTATELTGCSRNVFNPMVVFAVSRTSSFLAGRRGGTLSLAENAQQFTLDPSLRPWPRERQTS
eukprot:2247877-Pyramimonas_sp.AAC.1